MLITVLTGDFLCVKTPLFLEQGKLLLNIFFIEISIGFTLQGDKPHKQNAFMFALFLCILVMDEYTLVGSVKANHC